MTLRLLLVDDDPGLRALLRATLDAVDIEVHDAEDAVAAAEPITLSRPDAIVLDVNLPGMDGLAFCRQLKRNRRTRDIPIVVLSGSEGGSAEAALEAGADSFLRKPFSPLELLAVVERLAGGLFGIPFRATKQREPQEQLLLYARDLRHLLELCLGGRKLPLAPQSVCEIGCGAGEILRELSTRLDPKTRFVGYEISSDAYQLCRDKANGRMEFRLANLLDEDACFDLVMAIDVFEHVEDYFAFLRKLRTKGRHKIFHIPLELSAQMGK